MLSATHHCVTYSKWKYKNRREGARTLDSPVKSRVLYQLSYTPTITRQTGLEPATGCLSMSCPILNCHLRFYTLSRDGGGASNYTHNRIVVVDIHTALILTSSRRWRAGKGRTRTDGRRFAVTCLTNLATLPKAPPRYTQ